MRKIISVFLAVVMAFSLVGVMPISAFAETVEYSDRNKYESEYNITYYSEGNSWDGNDTISKISSVKELSECTSDSDILSKYDDAFFESKALIWIDTGTLDSSYSLRVVLVKNSENEIFIVLNIEQTPNIEVPQVVCDWDIVLEVEKAEIEKVIGIATDTLAPLPEETEPPMCWDGGSELVPPNKTVYTEGEILDLTGLEFYGLSGTIYGDGTESISRMPIDDYTVDLAGKPLTVNDKIVTVTGRHPTMGVEEKQTFEITVNPASEESVFSGGDGTKENPYIINSAKELDRVRYDLSAYYKLGCDIDLTQYLSEGGDGYAKWGESGWEPIGNSKDDEWFSGSFDGADHIISGLWIDRKDMSYVGFFSGVDSSGKEVSIQNLGIEIAEKGISGDSKVGGLVGCDATDDGFKNCYIKGGSVSGSQYVGGLIGFQGSTSLTINCYSEVDVISESKNSIGVGGLVGSAISSIKNCYATGNVTGVSECGGLIGNLMGMAEVVDSYATGNVTATGDEIGGLAGYCYDGNIYSSYSTGNVTGKSFVGGLVGKQGGLSIIDNCHHKGAVKATEDYAGGLVGAQISEPYFQNRNDISDCYVGGSVDTIGKHLGAISGYMDTESSISNCYRYADFKVNGAEIAEDDVNSAPDKINGGLYTYTEEEEEKKVFSGGDGTKENPYQVSTAEQLNEVRNYLSSNFIQVNDIDLTEATSKSGIFWNDGRGWIPMGEDKLDPFSGTYNGNGYSIIGMNINIVTDYTGLFGYVSGKVENLGMKNGNIQNNGEVIGFDDGYGYNIGMVAGKNIGTIRNCYNTGNINMGSEGNVGGITGKNAGIIESCYNTGNISLVCGMEYSTDNMYLGGICGVNDYEYASDYATSFVGIIKNCYNRGNISCSIPTSTLDIPYSSEYLMDSDLCAKLQIAPLPVVDEFVGGIVGYDTNNTVKVENCYTTGTQSVSTVYRPTNISVGGVTSYTLEKNYYNADSSVLLNGEPVASTSKNCGTPLNSQEMKTAEFVQKLGEAFVVDEKCQNDGYPILASLCDTYYSYPCEIAELNILDWNIYESDWGMTGQPYISVTVNKLSEIEDDGYMFIALYDENGLLVDASGEKVEFDSSRDYTVVGFHDIKSLPESVVYIKAYLWDSADSMSPLSLSKTWNYNTVSVERKTLADNSVDVSVSSKAGLEECKIAFPQNVYRWVSINDQWHSYKEDAIDVDGAVNIKRTGMYILYTKDKNGEEKCQYVFVDIPEPKVTINYTDGETQATFDVKTPNSSAKLAKLAVVYEYSMRVGDCTNANESWKYACEIYQSTDIDLNNPVFDVSVDGYYTVVAIDEWGNVGVESVQVGDYPWQ